jgi:hemolysin activation/secretion protein
MAVRTSQLLGLAAACALPLAAFGQSVTPGELDQAGRLGEQLLREQQQLEQERQRERERRRQQPAGQALPETATPPAAVAPEGECLQVSSLELVGARLLGEERIASLQQSVTGKCIGASDLNALLRRITDAYVSLGYVTTRAYVPPQDTKDGKLTLVVIEGTVERIEVEPANSASAATAFPHMIGEVFNLRAAEQGIDQLNRLSRNDARLDIRAGSAPGSSVLVVMNPQRRPISGAFSTDNTGSSETGEWQSTISLIADDLAGLNDGLILSHSRSLDDPDGPAASRSTMLSYSVPYGWWTGTLSVSESSYDSVVHGITRDFLTSGKSRNAGLRVDRVAYRDQSRKLTVYGGLTRRDSENFVAGQLIGSSSRALTVLDLEANLSLVSDGAQWSFDAGVARGLSWFGALDDASALPDEAPRAQFTKFTLGASVSRGFEAFGVRTQFTSALNAQWSNDVLYASEQISLAGPFSVRGYRDVRLYGDRGFTWRNELAFPFALGAGGSRPIGIRPFVGADLGRVWSHEDGEAGYMSGFAAGVNVSFAPVSLQLSWSGSGERSHTLQSDQLFFARLAVSL